MNRAEWDAMEAEDRDGFMAESVMRWRNLEGYWFRDGDEGTEPTGYYVYDGETLDRPGEMQWHPTTDRNACALVLNKIERKGLVFRFMDILIELLPSTQYLFALARGTAGRKERLWGCWLLFNTNPDTICYCAVKAVSGKSQAQIVREALEEELEKAEYKGS